VRLALIIGCALAGCHAAESGPKGRFPVPLTAQATEGDAIVATVEGRPIRASEIAAEARARGVSVKEALDDLITAEVLAGEAVRRGLDKNLDAQEAAEATAVRRLLATRFEAEVTPASVPMSLLRQVYDKNKQQLDHDVEIEVWHILVPKKNRPPESWPAARTAAEELARKARGVKSVDEFKALSKDVPGSHAEHIVTEKDGWTLKEFSYPAFDQLKRPGDTSTVIETSYGYHVLYLVQYYPAQHKSLAQAEPELRQGVFPEFQKPEFMRFVERVAGGHGVEEHPERLK
jgi:hypothetical protein